MPGGDRTGPRGMGSGTGRGAGYCPGNDEPGYMNRVQVLADRRGGGRRGGRGVEEEVGDDLQIILAFRILAGFNNSLSAGTCKC